jgi:hypothetical protein
LRSPTTNIKAKISVSVIVAVKSSEQLGNFDTWRLTLSNNNVHKRSDQFNGSWKIPFPPGICGPTRSHGGMRMQQVRMLEKEL